MSAGGPRGALLADIGGTNARFALLHEGRLRARETLKVADFDTIDAALEKYLESAAPARKPASAVFAVAGPVEDGEVHFTNSPWRISARGLRARFGFSTASVVNDFEAVAWALPLLGASDYERIGGGEEGRPQAPLAVIGPGTGLGVAGWIPSDEGGRALVTEGGHITMPAVDRREAEIIETLHRRFEHVSAERVLSGDGLVNLHRALAERDGVAVEPIAPATITERAVAGSDPRCVETLETFCAMLGTVAGDLALTFGARGGVYIAGGIVPRFTGYFAGSRFRERFEAKGRFQDYLAAIPVRVITHPDPAFVGLIALAERQAASC